MVEWPYITARKKIFCKTCMNLNCTQQWSLIIDNTMTVSIKLKMDYNCWPQAKLLFSTNMWLIVLLKWLAFIISPMKFNLQLTQHAVELTFSHASKNKDFVHVCKSYAHIMRGSIPR